jgi:hypothetical protein
MGQAVGTISNLRITGGTSNFHTLTRKRLQENPMEYKVAKAYAWLSLIQDGARPTKWYEPTKNGTKVKWAAIHDRPTYLMAMGEFRGYLDALNEAYPGLDLRLESDSEEQRSV